MVPVAVSFADINELERLLVNSSWLRNANGKLRRFLSEEDGAASVEYILILSGLGGIIAAGAFYFGLKIQDAMNARGDAIENCGTTPASC